MPTGVGKVLVMTTTRKDQTMTTPTYVIRVARPGSRSKMRYYYRNQRQAHQHTTLVKTIYPEQAKTFTYMTDAETVLTCLAERYPAVAFTIEMGA